jgi:hypothetical protein
MSPSKVNDSIKKDLKNSEVDEISNSEFKKVVVRMINKIKQHIYMHLNEFKEATNKEQNELKKIQTNSWMK